MITSDRGRGSIVVVCKCGARTLVNTDAQADAWAADHLERHRVLERRDEDARRAVKAAAERRRYRNTRKDP